ncbi:MAG: 50S ribosomal protein L17, partial [Minisyncoccia bacterium]
EIKRIIEKMVTKAKKGGLINQRYLLRYFDKKTVKKLMQEIAPLYKNRNGGYVRIYKLVPRISDSAKMAIIEFVK